MIQEHSTPIHNYFIAIKNSTITHNMAKLVYSNKYQDTGTPHDTVPLLQ